MTTGAAVDFTAGAAVHGQPDEPPLPMAVQQLTAVRDAARSVAAQPGAHAFDDFLIMNGSYRGYAARLLARGLWARIWPRAS